jgi:hypothetical protein
MAPDYLIPEKRVVLTFLRNSIGRKNCSWILKCTVDCINFHVDKAVELSGCPTYDEMLGDCTEHRWIRKLTDEEKKYYNDLADYNMKNKIRRKPGEDILWQKFHDELYPP